MYRLMLSIFLGLCSSSLWSFDCYLTLAKDNCWTDYNVAVDVIDDIKEIKLITITIPAGQQWAQQKFSCEVAQKLMYKASFTPIFWAADKGKSYDALRYWFLPATINPGDSAWDIPVCFPSDFSQVPFPPTAKGACHCDFSQVPKIQSAIIKSGS